MGNVFCTLDGVSQGVDGAGLLPWIAIYLWTIHHTSKKAKILSRCGCSWRLKPDVEKGTDQLYREVVGSLTPCQTYARLHRSKPHNRQRGWLPGKRIGFQSQVASYTQYQHLLFSGGQKAEGSFAPTWSQFGSPSSSSPPSILGHL